MACWLLLAAPLKNRGPLPPLEAGDAEPCRICTRRVAACDRVGDVLTAADIDGVSRRVPAGGVRLLLHGLPLCAGWSESDAGACGEQLKDIDFVSWPHSIPRAS